MHHSALNEQLFVTQFALCITHTHQYIIIYIYVCVQCLLVHAYRYAKTLKRCIVESCVYVCVCAGNFLWEIPRRIWRMIQHSQAQCIRRMCIWQMDTESHSLPIIHDSCFRHISHIFTLTSAGLRLGWQ